MTRRFWTPADSDLVRKNYGGMPAKALAEQLGRTERAIYQHALTIGVRKHKRTKPDAVFQAFVRRLNATGLNDTEVAAQLGCDRHLVSDWRKRLGLADHSRAPHWVARITEGTRRQCARAGVATLAAIRVLAFRQRAKAAGWPEDLRPRAVQILDALAEHGPMTRPEIASAIGLPWIGTRRSLKSNDPEGSYLANLMARGLVVSLGRLVREGGKGRNRHLYSLALDVERIHANV